VPDACLPVADHCRCIRSRKFVSDSEVLETLAKLRPALDHIPALRARCLSVRLLAMLDDQKGRAVRAGDLVDSPHDVVDRGVWQVAVAFKFQNHVRLLEICIRDVVDRMDVRQR